jgi:hypothetical protein
MVVVICSNFSQITKAKLLIRLANNYTVCADFLKLEEACFSAAVLGN